MSAARARVLSWISLATFATACGGAGGGDHRTHHAQLLYSNS